MLARAAVTSLGAWIVCVLIVAATDEGGITWATRVGRSLMTAPVCAAIGAGLTLSVARASGELRALEAIGRREGESVRSAIAGGVAPAMLLSALVLAALLDVSSFFPRSDSRKLHVRADATGFVDDERGLRIDEHGGFTPVARSTAADDSSVPASARLSAALTIALGSVVFARAAAREAGKERRRWIGWALVATALTIAAFQLAASNHLRPIAAPLPLAVLLSAMRIRYRWRDD